MKNHEEMKQKKQVVLRKTSVEIVTNIVGAFDRKINQGEVQFFNSGYVEIDIDELEKIVDQVYISELGDEYREQYPDFIVEIEKVAYEEIEKQLKEAGWKIDEGKLLPCEEDEIPVMS